MGSPSALPEDGYRVSNALPMQRCHAACGEGPHPPPGGEARIIWRRPTPSISTPPNPSYEKPAPPNRTPACRWSSFPPMNIPSSCRCFRGQDQHPVPAAASWLSRSMPRSCRRSSENTDCRSASPREHAPAPNLVIHRWLATADWRVITARPSYRRINRLLPEMAVCADYWHVPRMRLARRELARLWSTPMHGSMVSHPVSFISALRSWSSALSSPTCTAASPDTALVTERRFPLEVRLSRPI